MKRAVMLFERAEYWEQRAQAYLRHAKYEERIQMCITAVSKKSRREYAKYQKHIARSENCI